MSKRKIRPDRRWVIVFLLTIMITSWQTLATEAPRGNAELPTDGFANRLQRFTVKRGFLNLTRTVVANRAALNSGLIDFAAASSKGGVAINGKRAIPVIMLKYSDTPNAPYQAMNLQKELFDGPWPSGTMSDFYHEISYGRFTVTGTVYPWYTAKNKAEYYEGSVTTGADGKPKPCYGMCAKNHLGDLLRETLDEANKTIDFSTYDNDGPDGIPNSGDDDGYVDFVAFVHPGKGGECGSQGGEVNNNIWSHRFRLSDLAGRDYETTNLDKQGRRIRIDDYVIMPALDCDGKSMIEIGVFAHEFGHAFGLPDLYDTQQPAKSQGVGNWDLMGAGSWGGDNHTPRRPAHMSVWSKEFLGWISPKVISSNSKGLELRSVEKYPDALRINVSPDVYYLIEYRNKVGFDDSLTGAGVSVWRINDAVVRIGLLNNSVNSDVNNAGVYLVQADGLNQLDDITQNNRGDSGDLFPGSAGIQKLDNSTRPASTGKVAFCNIAIGKDHASLDAVVDSGRCD